MTILSILRNAIFFGLVLSVVSCGRKGPPKPPEDFAPKPVVNPLLQGSVDGVVLSWTVPEVDPEADEEDEIPPLAGFVIQKGDVQAGIEPEYEELVELGLKGPEETNYTFTDTKVEPGKTYIYQIRPVNSEGVSGEATVSLRATFIGENSKIELIPEKSKRPEPKIQREDDDDNLSDR
jgi:hypothetical protein